jgi:FdrA protein
MVRENEYHDSIQLMRVSEKLRKLEGVQQAMVAMGTDTNKRIIGSLGLMAPEAEEATRNDMLVAIEADSEETIESAVQQMEILFRETARKRAGQLTRHSLGSALRAMPDANMCVITVPGEYAAAEARKALEAGLHCVIYSDNVPLEEEREIKEFAAARGLLCMGPDCGVANINGTALLTASVVGRGPVGIAGASGSGTQQITVLVEREGLGVSQAIGLGGKDLLDEIGGIEMLFAIDVLEEDPETSVIVLVSRTPGQATLPRIMERVRACGKPVVVYFIGGESTVIESAGATAALDLEDAALKAVDLAMGRPLRSRMFSMPDGEVDAIVTQETAGMAPEQKHLRGLFCGGTFGEEAMALLHDSVGETYSNAPLRPDLKLANSFECEGHCVIDLGDEEFTMGRPHPAIDPEPIRQAIYREGREPDVAVLLMDFILSYAVNPDPVGSVLEALAAVKAEREKAGGYLSVVASVCGTEGDPQGLSSQEEMLKSIGAIVMPSNAQAARMAGLIAQQAAGRDGGRPR